MSFCKKCGNEMKDNEQFCRKCGTKRTEQTQRVCPKCGSLAEPGAGFCSSCGYAYQQQNQAPRTNHANVAGKEQKSKLVAALLAFFLGSLGVHNFYLGYTGRGVAQLLLTIIGSFLGLFIISGIWALIEGVLLLTGGIDKDAYNVPLKE